MKRIIIGLFVLPLAFSLNSQTNRAGIITKISGSEITVRNENPNSPFLMGETLHLLTGDKSVTLQVTFPMQASAKCKLISGSISKLRINSIVYSGGIPEIKSPGTVKTAERTNDKLLKIDDFNTFLGFSKGDTMDKAVKIFGNPSKVVKGNIFTNSNDYYCWTNEDNCFISIVSQKYSEDHNKISHISILSSFSKFEHDMNKSFYLDTTKKGTVHYLHSKGFKDPALDLFGISREDIKKVLGFRSNEICIELNDSHHYWYKTWSKQDVVFSFNIDEDKLYSIVVYLN